MTTQRTATVSEEKSTNGRIKWLSAGLNALSVVHPQAAVRAAQGLFGSPRRHDRPAREFGYLAGARPFTFVSSKHVLKAWSWGDSGPAILLVHGWEGRGAQLGALVAPLLERGYRVVAFDGPAHGESPGARATPVTLGEAILDITRWVSDVHGIVAHSMGALATAVALRRGLDVERVVFIAPGTSPADAIRDFGRQLGLGESLQDGLRDNIAEHFGLPIEQIEGTALYRGLQLPLQVFHDEGDREVAIELARELAESWPGAQLIETEGLGHRRILRDPLVIRETAMFFGEAPQRPHDPWKQFLLSDFGF